MSEISRYIPGPYNGISQVPPQVRLEGTCESMDDCIAIIPNGLQKRPPMEYLAKLFSSGAVTNPLVHYIPTGDDSTDVFMVLQNIGGNVAPGLFKVLDGTPVTCTTSMAASIYLALNNPLPVSDIHAKTVEDVTFLTNRTVAVGDGTDTVATRPFEALIWVKTGAYWRTYAVTVTPDGGTPVTCSYHASTGGSADDAKGVGTDVVTQALYDGTTVTGSNGVFAGTSLSALTSQGFTVELSGALIYISHPSANFTITASDDQGGTALSAIKDSVQRFSDLPSQAHDGFTVRIAQQVVGGNSDYFVKFVPQGSTTTGTWAEVLEPGSLYGLDATTMPVAIKNTAGVWTCEALTWGRRTTGNPTLSPDPDFMGQKIQGTAWWRGRLALLYHGGLYMSASDDPFKFYTSTLTTALDSDPIGLLTPADRKTFFKQAGVFDRQLVAFADEVQAMASPAGGVPKPGGVSFEQIGDSAASGVSPIQSAGRKLYFTAEDTSNTHVFEQAIDRLSGLPVVEDMSVSIPRYLPSGMNIAATRKKDYLTVRGTAGTSVLYLHTFRHADQQRVQNAWCTWNMPAGYQVVGLFFKGPKLYILARFSTAALYLFVMDVSQGVRDPGSFSTNAGTILTYLDLRIVDTLLGSAAFSGGVTTFTLPYAVTSATIASVRGQQAADAAFPEAYTPVVSARGSNTISLTGDWRGYPLWFGNTYTSQFVPSQWFQVGQDEKPVLTGSLMLQDLYLDLANFSDVSVDVRIRSRTTRTRAISAFEGIYSDDVTTPLDQAPKSPTRKIQVALGGDSEATSVRIYSDSHLGFALVGYEWVGDWTTRGIRRVS